MPRKKISTSLPLVPSADPPVMSRVLAFLVDALIVHTVIVSRFTALIERLVPLENISLQTVTHLDQKTMSNLYATLFFLSLMILLYFVVSEYWFQTTIGKKILGLSVESVDGSLTFGQVLVRNLVVLPFFPFFLLWVIDPLAMIIRQDHRRVSELLSGTRVVLKGDVL